METDNPDITQMFTAQLIQETTSPTFSPTEIPGDKYHIFPQRYSNNYIRMGSGSAGYSSYLATVMLLVVRTD